MISSPLPGALGSVLISYLLGSVSFGILISKRRGINLRERGSGNTGSTNVFRVIGKREGAMTLAGDVLKGTLAVLIARLMTNDPVWLALSALAAIVGHNFPVFHRFRGGKGVATTFGVLFVYMPWIGLILVLIWGVGVALTRISSVGALCVSLTLPVLAYWLGRGRIEFLFSLVVALMMIVRHRENIQRLLHRKELQC